ncbi:hypothetical protein [Actinoplanes sp. URMC 104]|uniref:hypothetical protein n=1 Tax=Actinoplanes sp. URMC 104 TaxID=3423409 RepID=UPI003F1DCB77
MDRLADRLDQSADAVTALSRQAPALLVAFAVPATLAASGAPRDAGAPGLPGRVGRALHDHWAAVVEARAHEASAAAAHLARMADSVRTTRRHYAETDEAVERRFHQEL